MIPELDEESEALRMAVATRLGWRSVEYSVAGVLVGYPPGKGSFRAVPSFARDMRAAWDLIDELFGSGLRVSLTTLTGWGKKRGYAADVALGGQPLAHGEGVSAALAICRAFLQTPEGASAQNLLPLRREKLAANTC
jgi:hypothetical protein